MDKETAFQLACKLSAGTCIEIESPEKKEETKRLLTLHQQLLEMEIRDEQKETIMEYVEIAEDVAACEMQDAFIAGFMACFEILYKRGDVGI